jgi:hypothetical protein
MKITMKHWANPRNLTIPLAEILRSPLVWVAICKAYFEMISVRRKKVGAACPISQPSLDFRFTEQYYRFSTKLRAIESMT